MIFIVLMLLMRIVILFLSQLYLNNTTSINRNTKVLYYDCTNFFLKLMMRMVLGIMDILKKDIPNPIVQMGLFLDGNGIPHLLY